MGGAARRRAWRVRRRTARWGRGPRIRARARCRPVHSTPSQLGCPSWGPCGRSGAKFKVASRRGRMPDLTAYLPGDRRLPKRGLIESAPSIAVEVGSKRTVTRLFDNPRARKRNPESSCGPPPGPMPRWERASTAVGSSVLRSGIAAATISTVTAATAAAIAGVTALAAAVARVSATGAALGRGLAELDACRKEHRYRCGRWLARRAALRALRRHCAQLYGETKGRRCARRRCAGRAHSDDTADLVACALGLARALRCCSIPRVARASTATPAPTPAAASTPAAAAATAAARLVIARVAGRAVVPRAAGRGHRDGARRGQENRYVLHRITSLRSLGRQLARSMGRVSSLVSSRTGYFVLCPRVHFAGPI
jgi:hypothetical protein